MSSEASALVAHKSDVPREAKKTKDLTFDRIYKYYHNEKTRIELEEWEDKIRDRWEKAWFLLTWHRTQKEVVTRLERIFGVAKSVAYNDVKNAMMVFGNPQEDLHQAKKAIAETMCLRGARKAFTDGNMDAYFKFVKEYRELNGLTGDGSEDAMAKLLKDLKPHQVIIMANKNDLETEANKLLEEITHDIEFKDAGE